MCCACQLWVKICKFDFTEKILLDDLHHEEEAALAQDHQSTKKTSDQEVDQGAGEEVGRQQEVQLEVLMKKCVKKLVNNVMKLNCMQ